MFTGKGEAECTIVYREGKEWGFLSRSLSHTLLLSCVDVVCGLKAKERRKGGGGCWVFSGVGGDR